ncbi:MAG: hypothetical protein MZU84_06905 [Sphingobacterium sp.]|nr:hypothetical protein [Sphingobacterium sp.]
MGSRILHICDGNFIIYPFSSIGKAEKKPKLARILPAISPKSVDEGAGWEMANVATCNILLTKTDSHQIAVICEIKRFQMNIAAGFLLPGIGFLVTLSIGFWIKPDLGSRTMPFFSTFIN